MNVDNLTVRITRYLTRHDSSLLDNPFRVLVPEACDLWWLSRDNLLILLGHLIEITGNARNWTIYFYQTANR